MDQLTSNDIIALRGWADFLNEQTAALDNAILRGNGVSFQPQPGDAIFLESTMGCSREQTE